jgi:glycosyltransferase involved in cell wall biosynthesis
MLCANISRLNTPNKKIEIVVSNNASTDNTATVLEIFADRHEYIVPVEQPVYLPSGEQNIFAGVEHCHGEYIWTISDDDRILEGTFERVLQLVSKRNAAFFLLNVCLQGTNGKLRAQSFIPRECFEDWSDTEVPFEEMVERLGFIGLLTSVSSAVFLRAPVSAIDWREVAGLSPIYAQSAIFYLAFKGRPSKFVAEPCIRVFDSDGVAFRKIASLSTSERRPQMYSWTIGLSRLIKRTGIDIGRVIEPGPFNTAWLGDSIIVHVCTQFEIWLETKDRAEVITDQDVIYITENICHTNTTRYLFMLNQLRDAGKLLRFLTSISSSDAVAARLTLLKLPDGGEALTEIIVEDIRQKVAAVRESIQTVDNGEASESPIEDTGEPENYQTKMDDAGL